MGIDSRTRRHPGRGDRRPADRRLAAGDGRRLRDPRRRRHPPQPDRDPPRRLPRRPGRPPRAAPTRSGSSPKRSPTRSTRLLHDNITEGTGTAAYTGCPGQGGKTGTTDHYTDAWFAGYPAQPGDRGLGRLPAVERDRNDQRPRHHRLRRHLPGRNLALALLQRRSPLRGIQPNRRRRSAGRRSTASSPPAAPSSGGSSGDGEAGEESEAERLGEEATGGYNPNAYAPGVGQEPTPVPPPPPPYGSGGGAGVGEAGSGN